ncbi:hypothetical protein B4U79_18174 [Dinothrombium tinctorium]|uniref:Uncharacterized protein n=1 Tax=Dinothrombium tinctorium TaxID=1965070 RepID=A0A443QZ34_9ACAR|nr:hypothetical protein B4U79_18174 [Dinothrombium tinctorium]
MDFLLKYKLQPNFSDENDGKQYFICMSLFERIDNLNELSENKNLMLCLINASLIADKKQVMVAANKALHSSIANKLKTKSLNSEILFNLSPSKNINTALNTFGINSKAKEFIAVAIEENGDNASDTPFDQIIGESVPFEKLTNFSDWDKINDSAQKHD